MATQEQIDQYHDRGYFITDDSVEPEMLEELTAATIIAADKARGAKTSLGSGKMTPPSSVCSAFSRHMKAMSLIEASSDRFIHQSPVGESSLSDIAGGG